MVLIWVCGCNTSYLSGQLPADSAQDNYQTPADNSIAPNNLHALDLFNLYAIPESVDWNVQDWGLYKEHNLPVIWETRNDYDNWSGKIKLTSWDNRPQAMISQTWDITLWGSRSGVFIVGLRLYGSPWHLDRDRQHGLEKQFKARGIGYMPYQCDAEPSGEYTRIYEVNFPQKKKIWLAYSYFIPEGKAAGKVHAGGYTSLTLFLFKANADHFANEDGMAMTHCITE